ncbi:hypothetical protein K8F61_09390 [Microbacterium resistens]|uniref:Uncharacterized protein n=1 Tax=Microbacterium resistens TaxID=156977 RepID=A0ABY3RY91_9MICO|nr:hypothetical protein [Microbacterium resistens]UGS28345.1 hypothetical protein K8F61_09390 [Microbacterium resistens]
MTDNNITLQAYIDQFDRLLKTAADFEESVLRDNRGMIFVASFEVFLTNDFSITAEASVGADGEILDVKIHHYEVADRDDEPRVIATLPVESTSGLWSAMKIWLEAMRRVSKQA